MTAKYTHGAVEVRPSDLVGCRYRFVQRQRHPDVPATPASQARADRHEAARHVVFAALPTRRSKGDGRSKPFVRIDLPGSGDPDYAELATLEAIAQEATLITGAVFRGESEGQRWRVTVDVLVRRPAGTYLPVIVSNHRVAHRSEQVTSLAIATNRLGLSEPVNTKFRTRHHVTDGYRLGLAARGLAEAGVDSGWGGVVGQDRTRAFLNTDTSTLQPALTTALAAGWMLEPRRFKECATCRFWSKCEPELRAADDISLVLPGDKARDFRERGITTVDSLAAAKAGEPSELARAWQDGVELLSRVDKVTGPRADVEVDVDVEAYLDQGAYLWGGFDGQDYHGFATWEPLGGDAEAANFVRFWDWLMNIRDAAHSAGRTFAAYCYSAHGENHWLRRTASRFAGYKGMPSMEEIDEFIASDEWVDLFAYVRAQLFGPNGIGLKVVAPVAGYRWAKDGFDGEDSVHMRRLALSDQHARATLLQYNEDDTRATAWVRQWLRDGAPGVPRSGYPAR